MPIITTPLKRNDTGPAVADLQNALLRLGSPIADAEKAAKRFGDSTFAAVIAWRKQFGLPEVNGNVPPFDASVGRLLNVAAAANDGNVLALRSAVRESVAAAAGATPQENQRLARYAVMARDYTAAKQAASRALQLGDQITPVTAIITIPSPWPAEPEITHPENFYTYRQPPLDPAVVDHVANDLTTLKDTDWNPLQRDSAPKAIAALQNWNTANEHCRHRRYDAAVSAYDSCQDAVLAYFDNFYLDVTLPAGDQTARLIELIRSLYRLRTKRTTLWESLRLRRQSISLAELKARDSISPGDVYNSAASFVQRQLGNSSITPDPVQSFRESNLDAHLVALAFVLVPLARAEANGLRRQYEAALTDLRWVLTPITMGRSDTDATVAVRTRLACEFIEVPFARLVLAETMLDQAEAEYKARVPAAPAPAADVSQYQNLKAAQTYLELVSQLKNEGEYVARVEHARNELELQIIARIADKDTHSAGFQLLGNTINVPTISPLKPVLPAGPDRHTSPHEPILKFTPPVGQDTLVETNPRVYAVLLSAQARLEQLRAQFNYLGYTDDYVPPWRFQFLVEHSRYFAEHARNAQRDYLNFLSNAEHEEFQELSASQNVELEKSNVSIETARVNQVRLEVFAANQSLVLADEVAGNAQTRYENYKAFDQYADDLYDTEGLQMIMSTVDAISGGLSHVPVIGTATDILGDLLSGGLFGSSKHKLLEAAQRELEKQNLRLAVNEADQSRIVAGAQLKVAEAGLLVAGLQRQAALLRHDFAVQNLSFLRNRVLAAEQWFRLAGGIRSVSETYLRYAIELAFLAEQAYEFEADKTLNVIRFDYDQSEGGDFLAADFLLRDLDTLEQDLVISQRERQQQVRYAISMAREFPAALQELREHGETTFSLTLDQLERRFPGLYNVRIGAVDVLPMALMDSSRFSMALTHRGNSRLRLRRPSGSDDQWAIRALTGTAETTIFSGLARQDAGSIFPFSTTGQRNAFEGLGAACAWKIDMSMKENQVVPGTLADLLITFTLSAYYDADLRTTIEQQQRQPSVLTRWLSARQEFPDAFYDFNRTGKMEWSVGRDLLTLTDSIGALRNVGVMLVPAPAQAEFGPLMCRYQIDFEITAAGDLKILSDIPQFKFDPVAPAGSLKLKAKVTAPAGANFSWNFGDGGPLQTGATVQHTYDKPGKYQVTSRIIRGERLIEYRANLSISRDHRPTLPLTIVPSLSRDLNTAGLKPGHTRVAASATADSSDPISAAWTLTGQPVQRGNRVIFDLEPGKYSLNFTTVRTLQTRAYCKQRFTPEKVLPMPSLTLTSNRTFDENGEQTTGAHDNPPANPFTAQLFNGNALSPLDDWTLELPLADNPALRGVDFSDSETFDMGELRDAFLVLEYETKSE